MVKGIEAGRAEDEQDRWSEAVEEATCYSWSNLTSARGIKGALAICHHFDGSGWTSYYCEWLGFWKTTFFKYFQLPQRYNTSNLSALCFLGMHSHTPPHHFMMKMMPPLLLCQPKSMTQKEHQQQLTLMPVDAVCLVFWHPFVVKMETSFSVF